MYKPQSKSVRITNSSATGRDVILTMSGSNPGAMRVCMDIMTHADKIDEKGAMGGFGPILMMDTLNIYEHRIWMLYKDVCKEDIGKMMAVLRAYQMGQLEGCTEQALNHAIDHCGEGLDVEKIVNAVQGRLPWFKIDAWKVK